MAAGFALALAAPAAGASTSPYYTFRSAPDVHPPRVQVLVRKQGIAQGDFLGVSALPHGRPQGTGQAGPLILDDHARPIWFLPVKGEAFALQQETYQGKPVLVSFQTSEVAARRGRRPPVNPGEWVIFDEHYRKIAGFKASSPWMTDLHDAWITGGDIWITVSRLVPNQDLAPYGGPQDGGVLDVGLQEFQVGTGRLIRTWDALNPGGKANVPLSASEEPAKSGSQNGGGPNFWDAYHLNSVEALPDGDLLVSMRNTWAVYLINPVSDRIVWTLGGKDSSFQFGPGAGFAWQHDARFVHPGQEGHGPDVKLTLFNDNNGGPSQKPSAGMVISLDTISQRATLVHAYRHHPPLSAGVLGSMQLLPNGNALVGWGSEPYFSEYSASGKELLDARWPGAGENYRTLFTNTWVGVPLYPPRGAAQRRVVYASWNGATQVARWEVLAGSRPGRLKRVATHARNGFETAIKLRRSYGAYEVRGLGANGHVLGTSKPFT